ncbi:hypothetical protein V6Z11_1Z045900 [Gossypium hirsutum]
MTLPSMKTVHLNTKWGILERVSIFRRFFSFLWDKILVFVVVDDNKNLPEDHPPMICNGNEADSDLVSLKISLLGDCQIGKTSFLIKYVGDEQEKSLQTGLNLVNKTLFVQGARIAFSIWDVGGDSNSLDLLPIACKNAVAILFMFDLTSRCTLNGLALNLFLIGVVGWYSQARKWNQCFYLLFLYLHFADSNSNIGRDQIDDFVGPPRFEWTIVTQARAYARAMNATLFFSIERNLTIGEPIIDF